MAVVAADGGRAAGLYAVEEVIELGQIIEIDGSEDESAPENKPESPR